MPPLIPPPDSIAEQRDIYGALYERPAQAGDPPGHRRFQHQGGTRVEFVPDDVPAWENGLPVTWEIPNTLWEETPTDYKERTTYYKIRASKSVIGYQYVSRSQGNPSVEMLLTHINGQNTFTVPPAEIRGRELWWVDIVPGLDIFLRLMPDKAEFRKIIRAGSQARSLRWMVRRSTPSNIILPTITTGQDNLGMDDPARPPGMGPGRRRRVLEMEHAEGVPDTSVPGEVTNTFDETWTGNTWEIPDKVTREKVLSPDVSYPVEIDVTVSEQISTDADDGEERNGTWYNSYSSSNDINLYAEGSGHHIPGWRFLNITVPKDATIDDATFLVERTRSGSSGQQVTADFNAAAEDNPAGWSNANGPTAKTPTANSPITGTPWFGTLDTDVSIDVKALIEDITTRAGWVSGNAVAFYCSNLGGGSSAYQYLEDEADSPPGSGRLIINYTSGPAPDPVFEQSAYRARNDDGDLGTPP